MSQRKFRKGDLVKFPYGKRYLHGTVKEDRGPIGVKGRILYLIEFRPESQSDSLSYIELPEDQLQGIKGTVSLH